MRKITFMIPLRAPSTCRDWATVCRMCRGTLTSIAQQTSSAWQCVLVCHEPPPDIPRGMDLTVLQVGSPAPTTPEGFRQDKHLKRLAAIEFLRARPSEYCMQVDADDRLHRELVAFIDREEAAHGWSLANGYVYQGGSLIRRHRGTFDKLCGSSSIRRCHFLLHEDPAVAHVGHAGTRRLHLRRSEPLNVVPFFAATKLVNYGDNLTETLFLWSGFRLRTLQKLFRMRPVTRRFRRDFALDVEPARVPANPSQPTPTPGLLINQGQGS